MDPEHKRFKPYYGVAFISMLPKRVQDDLYDKVILLERELKIQGLLTWFLFVPPETYYFTLEGVIERSSPDSEQDEVDHHFSVAMKNKKTDIPTGAPFDVEALRQATSQAFIAPSGSPLRWTVDDAKMDYFSSMEYYEEIPNTELSSFQF